MTIKYWIIRLILLGLCFLHDYTKYKTARNLKDLFYWPEGICLDTIVVITALTISICIFVDETVWDVRAITKERQG